MSWDPGEYDYTHHYVTDYGRSLLDLLAPKPGERILDLGCGTGHLTHEIAAGGAVVVGIDSSAEMIAQARQNYPKLRFELADATKYRTIDVSTLSSLTPCCTGFSRPRPWRQPSPPC